MVLGRNKLNVAAKRSRETTSSNGIAGAVYPKAPKQKVPMMAPIRAINKCIPMAVDLKLKRKGKRSILSSNAYYHLSMKSYIGVGGLVQWMEASINPNNVTSYPSCQKI